MIKNDWILAKIAEKFNFKVSTNCTFGVCENQILKIEPNGSSSIFSLTFLVRDSFNLSTNKELIKKFNQEFRVSSKMKLVDDIYLVIGNISVGMFKDSAVEKLSKIIFWWTRELTIYSSFEGLKTEQVVLFNRLPNLESKSYQEELENRIKRNLEESPVDNISGIVKGGIVAILLSILFGIVEAQSHIRFNFRWPVYFDALIILILVVQSYKRFSNGLRKNSIKYVGVLTLACLFIAQFTNISFVLSSHDNSSINVLRTLNIFFHQFTEFNKYAGALILSLFYGFLIIISLKIVPEILEIDKGKFLNAGDIEVIDLKNRSNNFFILLFLGSNILTIAGILTAAIYVLNTYYFFENWAFFWASLIIIHLIIFTLIAWTYYLKFSSNPFKRFSFQKKTEFIAGHIIVQFISLFFTISTLSFFSVANVYLDPFAKNSINGVLLRDFPDKLSICTEFPVQLETTEKVEFPFCDGEQGNLKKGDKIKFIKGKGLFRFAWLKRE